MELNRYVIRFRIDGEKDIAIKEAINHKNAMEIIKQEHPGKTIVFVKWRNIEDMDTDGIRLSKEIDQ